MRNSKLQKRLRKHKRRERTLGFVKGTAEGTIKNTAVLVVFTVLIAYPSALPKTGAFFTSETKKSGDIQLAFKNLPVDVEVDHDESSFIVRISNFSVFDMGDFDLDYIHLLYGSNSLVGRGKSATKAGEEIILYFDLGEVEALFQGVAADQGEVELVLTGRGELEENSFSFKGSRTFAVSNRLSIKETDASNSLAGSKQQSSIKLYHTVQDQKGDPVPHVQWTIEKNQQGITVNSRTGEVTIPAGVTGGNYTLTAAYRNILGRTLTDTHTLNIGKAFEEFSSVTSLTISGSTKVNIPKEGENSAGYAATVKNQNGDTMAGEAVRWSLASPVPGVDIDGATGRLRVTGGAGAGTVTIVATSGSNGSITDRLTVELVAPVTAENPENKPEQQPEQKPGTEDGKAGPNENVLGQESGAGEPAGAGPESDRSDSREDPKQESGGGEDAGPETGVGEGAENNEASA